MLRHRTKVFCSVDGALYNKDKTTLILCPCQKGSINIPSSVTKIAESAFRECSAIKSLTLPNSVEYMGSYVFQGCENLESFTIQNSVKSWAMQCSVTAKSSKALHFQAVSRISIIKHFVAVSAFKA